MSHISRPTAQPASLRKPPAHLWHGLVRCFRKGLRMLALAGLTGSLSACILEDPAATMLVIYGSAKTDEERQVVIERNFVEPKYVSALESGTFMLGITDLYMDFEEYRLLITDHESFMRYGVGLYLARSPGLTYENLRTWIGPDIDNYDVDQATVDYYRLWGQSLLDEVKSRPENQHLVEREHLFLARLNVGEADMRTVNRTRYVELLNDTERFARFLEDDATAKSLIRRLFPADKWDFRIGTHQLGPAYTGVTPGTGS